MFRFEALELFWITIPVLFLFTLYRVFLFKFPTYVFPPSVIFANKIKNPSVKILSFLRFLFLLILAFLIARPIDVDEGSKIVVEGVAIAVALDLSGSMTAFDDLKDRRPRYEVAKEEAINFLEKRVNDPAALIIFGKNVITRAPLTLDKRVLKEIIIGLDMGVVDPNGTSLGTAIATAVSRLRHTNVKSKIAIVLTDGVPVGDEISCDLATELAKKFDIKIYTIAVGRKGGGFKQTQFGILKDQDGVDETLLQKIASQTGGAFFRANSPKEMKEIYNKIDLLEKTKQESPIFSQVSHLYRSFMLITLLFFFLELLLRLFYFRGLV